MGRSYFDPREVSGWGMGRVWEYVPLVMDTCVCVLVCRDGLKICTLSIVPKPIS